MGNEGSRGSEYYAAFLLQTNCYRQSDLRKLVLAFRVALFLLDLASHLERDEVASCSTVANPKALRLNDLSTTHVF